MMFNEKYSPIGRSLAAFAAGIWFCLTALGISAAGAATPEEAGLDIATKAYAASQGFGKYEARQTMTLVNKRGQESVRELRTKVLEAEDEGNKILFVFDTPRDVKGTAFLIHSKRSGNDDQWLYLPALKRVKRISSSNSSGSFMGSEFAYEDLGTPEVEKYTYRHLRDEPCDNGRACTVMERIPAVKGSGYSSQQVWHDKEDYRVWKVDYYDRKKDHMKTLTMEEYGKFLDNFWFALEMTMINHQTGKSTVIAWSDFDFEGDIKESDFSKTGLKRVR